MSGFTGRRLPALLLLCAMGLIPRPGSAAEFGDPAARMHVDWSAGRIIVGVLPRPNEGYLLLARRLLDNPDNYRVLAAFNRNRPVMAGVRIKVPLNLLILPLRGEALRALYPEDELTERGWAHRVESPVETLIQLTEAYTGTKARFRQLARLNNLKDPNVLRMGTQIVIPLHWIPEALGFRPMGLRAPLTLIRDKRTGQSYAGYTPRRGDTLYSIILRFTDRERAAEVRRMSRLLLALNRLKSEKALPAGRLLRLPLTWISEDYLVQRSPSKRRAPPPRAVRRRPKKGKVHVIIDPGHGGVDAGAVYGSLRQRDRVYEHEVVYDIALRAMKQLRARGYPVYPTLMDPRQTQPVKTLSMKNLGRERVLVNPPYRVTSARVGVNMRIYLIDALFRRLTRKQGVPPENIVLISIHGDALVPTMRGAMVYYPDHRLRVREFGPTGRVYRLRKEAVPTAIYYRQKESRAAQGASEAFARDLVAAFRARGVGVSRRKPIRSYYYRDGQRTLPGVLRYSRVPVSVLMEVANLNNRADRVALLRHSNRTKIAKAIADAVDRFRARRRTVASRTGAG